MLWGPRGAVLRTTQCLTKKDTACLAKSQPGSVSRSGNIGAAFDPRRLVASCSARPSSLRFRDLRRHYPIPRERPRKRVLVRPFETALLILG